MTNSAKEPVELEDKIPSAAPITATEAPSTNHKRAKMLWLLTAVLGAIGLGWFLLWFFYFQYFRETEDAYANGSTINISPVVSGSVMAFYADDTDLVLEGQRLVELDPTFYQIAYEKSLAVLAAQVLQLKQLSDDALAAQANAEIKKVLLSKSRFDYENRSLLVDSKAVSKEDFIHSRDDLSIAEDELKKAEYQLKVAQDILGNTPIDQHPLLEEKKAAVREAYYNLKHCTIFAPTTGYVAKRAVNVGQSVQRTSNLMAIIPVNYVWVDANFKETELTYMRVGQPATVWFDIYGSGIKFQGKVLGIGLGSGSVFSIIPPQNATGNWIKIVQRIPVRISLDSEMVKQYPVRLGISAEVTVDITDQNLPFLTQVPPSKPVATTNIYDIHLEEVGLLIDQIVETNLRSP